MNKKEIDAPTLVLIIILMMALINGLTSCSTAKVYKIKDQWSAAPKTSSATGWSYSKK